MNLSILQYDETTQQCTITLRQGPWAGRVFSGDMRVCGQPTCDCGELDFTVKPDPATALPADPATFNFSLDTLEGRVSTLPDGAMSPDELSLATAVVAELRESDWEELFNLLYWNKYDAIESVDPRTLDLNFACELDVGTDGLLAFSDVFPHGCLGSVTCGDRDWYVEDLYCVDPDCQCHEVLLTFIPKDIENPKDFPCPTFFYDYRRRKIGNALISRPTGQGTLEEFLAKARSLRSPFDLEVENRHLKLRMIYLRSLVESAPQDDQTGVTQQKIGRNDPCPCGSGKKYKRCCGVATG